MKETVEEHFQGFKVEDIFTIELGEEEDDYASFQIGFTELGNKLINELINKYPQVTEKHIEEYIKSETQRLLVFLMEKKEKEKE